MPVNPTDQQEFSDADFRIVDNGDQSKKLAFQVSGVATATTRTLTISDKDGTVLLSTDLAANVAAWLADPTSAKLAAAVTDETGTAGNVVFSASPTLTGTLTAVAATLSGLLTTNGQIKGPSTANPSSDPFTFDDYREGSTTLSLKFGGASVGMTITAQTFHYTKAARNCLMQGRMTLSAKGSSVGTATLTNILFTSLNAYGATIDVGYYGGMASLTAGVAGYVEPGNTFAAFTAPGTANTPPLTEANFTDTSDLIFSIAFQTAS